MPPADAATPGQYEGHEKDQRPNLVRTETPTPAALEGRMPNNRSFRPDETIDEDIGEESGDGSSCPREAKQFQETMAVGQGKPKGRDKVMK